MRGPNGARRVVLPYFSNPASGLRMVSKRIVTYTAPFCIASGSALSLWVCLSKGQASIGLTALIMSSWVVATVFLMVRRQSPGLAVGTALMLGFELFSYVDVFVSPQSSTAALVYVVKPFWQVFVCLPLGFVVAWLARRLSKAAQ